MAAYVIADIRVHDEEGYENYKRLAQESIAQYGGTYIARGGRRETLEGDWEPARVVLLKFDSVEAVQRWWASTEYDDARKIRQRTANSNIIVVEGT